MRSKTVTKEIHFYRVDIGLNENRSPKIFNPVPTLERIGDLKWNAQGRYWEDGDKITACWVDSTQMPCKVRLGTIRRDELPQVEQAGETTPLEMTENAGLVEQTHIVFFENNIAGCDFNFYGPRISRFSYYCSEK